MTYNVFSGTLNPTHSLTHSRSLEFVVNSSFKKTFSTKWYHVANGCAQFFNARSGAFRIKERLSF